MNTDDTDDHGFKNDCTDWSTKHTALKLIAQMGADDHGFKNDCTELQYALVDPLLEMILGNSFKSANQSF